MSKVVLLSPPDRYPKHLGVLGNSLLPSSMTFSFYTGTSALIIFTYISDIQRTQKYGAVMYNAIHCNGQFLVGFYVTCSPARREWDFCSLTHSSANQEYLTLSMNGSWKQIKKGTRKKSKDIKFAETGFRRGGVVFQRFLWCFEAKF